MGRHKYYKYMIDNHGDQTRIAGAMWILHFNRASYRDVSQIMYGLGLQCNGIAIIEGYIPFFDKQDGHINALDMPDFDLRTDNHSEPLICITSSIKVNACSPGMVVGIGTGAYKVLL